MKKISFILFCLSIICCGEYNDLQLIRSTAAIFDELENSLLKDVRVNVIRRDSNPIEYELRKKNKAGFAVFQVHPEKKVLKNLTDNSITTNFVSGFSRFNHKPGIVLQLLENIDGKKNICFNTNGKIIHMYKRSIDTQTFSSNQDSIVQLENGWKYIIKNR